MTMRRHYTVEVSGRAHRWAFPITGTPQDVADWRADSLKVDEVINTIPAWWPFSTSIWCWVEDLYRLRWLERSSKEGECK